MMPLVAILCVFGGFMGLDQNLSESWTVIFCVIGGVVLVLGVAGFFLNSHRLKVLRLGYDILDRP